MQKEYTILEIYEADFGCEERPAGQKTMVGVHLRDTAGNEIHVQEEDDRLYEKDINEGDTVILLEGRLEKKC